MSGSVIFPNLEALLRAVEEELHDVSFTRGHSRFCTRFLLVSTANQWNELVHSLRERLKPQELRLSTFTKSDAMPCLEAWKTGPFSKTALLLPLMEAVRFRSPENILTAFATVATFPGDIGKPSPNRLYVPLLCDVKMLEHSLHQRCDRFRRGLLPEIWGLPQEEDAPRVVISTKFPSDIPDVLEGLPAYLTLWEQAAVPPSCLVRTPIAAWTSLAEDVVASVCATPRTVVQHFFAMDDLPKDAPAEFWVGILAHGRRTDTSIQNVVSRLLNRSCFRPEDAIIALYDLEPDSQESALIWTALRHWSMRGFSYIAVVCRKIDTPRQLCTALYETVLDGDVSPDDLALRRVLLRSMNDTRPPSSFLEKLRVLPPRRRLDLLSDASLEEKVLIVQTVGELLSGGHDLSAVSLWLQDIFPLLAAYLTPLKEDADLQDYFRRFVEARLRNEPTSELRAQQEKIANQRRDLPHIIEPRAHVLRGVNAPIRWMDGLGLEWHGVAKAAARAAGVGYTMTPVRATLPTTTASNKEWTLSEEKISTLDSLGHAGDYTFPVSFLKQMQAVDDFVRDMAGKLRHGFFGDDEHSLVLTGDHGLTPVVFHREAMPVPSGFDIVKDRALVRTVPESACPEHLAMEGEFCYIRGFGRFAGGQTKGTIHGGATLEELLVPVITLTLGVNGNTSQPPLLSYVPSEITLSPLGEAVIELTLSRPASDILLEQNAHLFAPDATQEGVVTFRLRGLSPGKTIFSLYAEQCRIEEFSVQLIAGLNMNDMGI